MNDPGHVFVVNADLTRLVCDDVVVPTDEFFDVGPHWYPLLPQEYTGTDGPAELRKAAPGGWPERRAFELGTHLGRRVWLVNTGGTEATPAEWYADGVRHVLDLIARDKVAPGNGRARRLVCLPLVGTGAGGADLRHDEVIRAVLAEYRAATERHGFDVAFVLGDRRSHAAVQSVRSREPEWRLAEPLERHAVRLAAEAADGHLVLFLGAGVSMSAGLPSWNGLLQQLGAGRCTKAELAALRELGPLDAAAVLERRFETSGKLQEELRRIFTADRHALSHALLAAMPVTEVVTTNYDTLFELACEGRGDLPDVLPFDQPRAGRRWVLKLHGDVGRSQSMVLTRQQYLQFDELSAALAGIVQALLLTRHMLFVGFSLVDDNFLRLADQVRRALAQAEHPRRTGTALALIEKPLRRELWQDELEYIAMEPFQEATPEVEARAARSLEVFLDRLACLTTDVSEHLLDERYDGLLSKDEQALAGDLRSFAENLSPRAREAGSFEKVAGVLRSLGLDEKSGRRTPGSARRAPETRVVSESLLIRPSGTASGFAIYIGTSSNISGKNLAIGLERGIWGWKLETLARGDHLKAARTIEPGDVILLGVGGLGRIDASDLQGRRLERLVVARAKSGLYRGDDVVWPDAAYGWRLDLDIVDDAAPTSDLRDGLLEPFRLSAVTQGSPVPLPPSWPAEEYLFDPEALGPVKP